MSTPDPEARLRAEGLSDHVVERTGHRYGAHEHGYDKAIVAVRGSIHFGLPASGNGRSTRRSPELPAGTSHDALVGPSGVESWPTLRPEP
jgi:hypothetical protein